MKFNSYFKLHLIKLLSEEALQKQIGEVHAPKYSVCFMDLADTLGFKEEILKSVNSFITDEQDACNSLVKIEMSRTTHIFNANSQTNL